MTTQQQLKLKKWSKILFIFTVILLIVLSFLASLGTIAEATGLVDNTVDNANEYSRYPLEHYQLDFYVDNSWSWLPWNWTDGIGQQVMYGLYSITSFIWMVNLYLSYATGYLIQEAYSLDFISDTADAIGENMQTLAGITRSGFSSEGFYIGFLLLLILVVGMYVTYVGLIKRETTKAIHAVTNFVVVFLLSSAFIAYAPDTIGRINEFSSDISQASLSLGTRMILPNSSNEGSNSVDLIRDSLFSIQVKQPWLLLQYGTNSEEDIGEERMEELLSTSPFENGGEDREAIVIVEIEERDNTHLTITQATNRLGVVFFISLFNMGISIFVFLLTGIMIFSQILFIIYAMFLPISFLLSMIPTFGHLSKRALTKLFNVILARAGITLILTIAFSLSSMLYSLSSSYPFFLIAFLQIVTFAGIYFKLSDLMGLFALQSNESQSVSRRVMRKPRMLMVANMHRLQRKLHRSIGKSGKDSTTKDPGNPAKDSSTPPTQNKPHNRHNEQSNTPSTATIHQKSKLEKSKNTNPPPTPPVRMKNERPNQKKTQTHSQVQKESPQETTTKGSTKRSQKPSSTSTRQSHAPISKRSNQKESRKKRQTVAEKRKLPHHNDRQRTGQFYKRPSVQQFPSIQKRRTQLRQQKIQGNPPLKREDQINRKSVAKINRPTQLYKARKNLFSDKKHPSKPLRQRKDRRT